MRPRLHACLVPLAAAVFTLASGGAVADDAELIRCSANADAGTRLACFDALAAQARARQASPAAAAARAAAAERRVGDFGRPPQADPSGLDEIESRIAGRFDGWDARSRLRLANGQVWQIADDSSSFGNADSPKVKIRRGAMGAYYLEVEGLRKSPRVRRVE